MKDYRNDCVCCDVPCSNCGRKHTPITVCDYCGKEITRDGYKFEGEDFCPDCLSQYLINRFFSERREDAEKYFVDRAPFCEDLLLNEIQNEWSDKELYDNLSEESVEDLIDYLKVDAYPLED